MKKSIAIIASTAVFFLLLTNCKKEEKVNVSENDSENFEVKIYTNTSEDYDKNMEGETNKNFFTSYGEFQEVIGEAFFIPKNIKTIITENKDTEEKVHISYDENTLPTSFYEYNGGTNKEVFYQVFYETERTVIYQNTLIEAGKYKITDSIELAPLSQPIPKVSAAKVSKTQEAVDCEKLLDETGKYLNPCSDETLYQDIADEWEKSSKFGGAVKAVGESVSWIISTFQEKVCADEQSSSKVAEQLSCDEYEPNGEEDLCGVVMSCETDCNGDLNGTAYTDECNNCVGGNTGNKPCKTDCNGDPNGTATIDNCGICAGGNTGNIPNESCKDCNGDLDGTATIDECGECTGGNTGKIANESCADCNGDPNGTATLDSCGDCVGGNTGTEACFDSTAFKVYKRDFE